MELMLIYPDLDETSRALRTLETLETLEAVFAVSVVTTSLRVWTLVALRPCETFKWALGVHWLVC